MNASKAVALLRVEILLLATAVMGCAERPQVDYSKWKDVQPDVECAVPPIVMHGDPVNLPEIKAVTDDVIRFSGSVERDTQGKEKGTFVGVEVVKRSGKRITTLRGGSAVVNFPDADKQQYEVFLKAPEPGVYSTVVKVGGSEAGHGKISVKRKAGN